MLTADSRGLFVIAPTPFHPDGRVDEGSIDRLCAHYPGVGATGLTVLGIMGEAGKLDGPEALAVAKRFIARAQGLPVIVGASAPGFAAMRSLARAAMDAGAAGVMVAPPASARTDDQIAAYFEGAVEAVGADAPLVIQDFPLVTGVVMAPSVIRRIATAHPSVVMLKHEDWPGLDKISQLRAWEAEGALRRLSILTGNGGLFLDFEVERGADGAMTGYAYPEMLSAVVRLGREGRRDEAHDLFDAHLPLVRYEQQLGVGLAVRKHVLMRRGLIASDAQRRPGPALSPRARAEVDYLMARVEQRVGALPGGG